MFCIREHDLQLTASDGFCDMIGVKASQSTPPDGGSKSCSDRVYCYSRIKLHNARHSGVRRWSETPRIDTEIREGNNFVRSEVRRFSDRWMARQIAGRADHNPAHFGSNARCDQRRVWEFGDAHRHINAFLDEVYVTVQQQEARRDHRISVQKVVEDWPQHILSAERRSRNGKYPPRFGMLAAGKGFCFLEFGQNAAARASVALTCLAQHHGARCPVEQLGPHMPFQEGDSTADGCWRSFEAPGGSGETAFFERRKEDRNRLYAIHYTPPTPSGRYHCPAGLTTTVASPEMVPSSECLFRGFSVRRTEPVRTPNSRKCCVGRTRERSTALAPTEIMMTDAGDADDL